MGPDTIRLPPLGHSWQRRGARSFQQNQPAAPFRQAFLKPRQRFQQELHPVGRTARPTRPEEPGFENEQGDHLTLGGRPGKGLVIPDPQVFSPKPDDGAQPSALLLSV